MALRLRERFGDHVRRLRRARELTQEELAERADLSVDAIRRIERGRLSPTLDTLRKLSGGLDISLHTMFQSLDAAHPDHVAEICDFLAARASDEVRLAWRVIHAMFEDRDS